MDPLDVKPELIVDIALGFKPHDQICAKYGLSDQDLLKLYTQEWFNRAIADKKQELEKAGFNFTAKMKMMAEDMLIDAYHAAKLSDAVTPKLDVAKQLVKVAGLEPLPNAQQLPGAGFSININFNGGRETITLETTRAEDAAVDRTNVWTLDGGRAEPQGAPLAHDVLDLPVSVRKLNDDLGGDSDL